jgi:hypothetical protein
VGVATLLLLVVYAALISLVSERYVGGRGDPWTLPAAAASIVALLGLAASGTAGRRAVAEEGDARWLATGAAVAGNDHRAGERGRLVLAVVLWVGVSLVLGGAGLLAAYLRTHRLLTIG